MSGEVPVLADVCVELAGAPAAAQEAALGRGITRLLQAIGQAFEPVASAPRCWPRSEREVAALLQGLEEGDGRGS